MDIAILTEGTYPFHAGGVSVWCDQLVRGLPEHNFHVIAVTSDDSEVEGAARPSNLTKVTKLPVWGPRPASRRVSQVASRRFREAHREFVDSVVHPDEPGAVQQFVASLKSMFDYAREASLSAALLSNEALSQLSDAWQEAGRRSDSPRKRHVAISFADALTATDLIEHFLRPLSFTPPKADLFHAVSNGLCALVGLTGKWEHGAPFILTEHGIYLRERYLSYLNGPGTFTVKTLLLNFLRLLSSAVYSEADVIKPASDYNQRWELRNGAEPTRIDTIYNGIDIDSFPVDTFEPAVPTISWLGRIDPLKDLKTLIRAFGYVRKELPAARLRLFGTAPAGNEAYLAACRSLVDELGLGDAVSFEGRVADPADAYRAGTLVVLSSISEGFPYTLIEAMASGKATVSTRVGGVPEAVGSAGLMVAPRDELAMAQACMQLLTDPELRRTIGVRARRRIIENFTLAQCLDAYRVVYRVAYRENSAPTRTQRRVPETVSRALGASLRPT